MSSNKTSPSNVQTRTSRRGRQCEETDPNPFDFNQVNWGTEEPVSKKTKPKKPNETDAEKAAKKAERAEKLKQKAADKAAQRALVRAKQAGKFENEDDVKARREHEEDNAARIAELIGAQGSEDNKEIGGAQGSEDNKEIGEPEEPNGSKKPKGSKKDKPEETGEPEEPNGSKKDKPEEPNGSKKDKPEETGEPEEPTGARAATTERVAPASVLFTRRPNKPKPDAKSNTPDQSEEEDPMLKAFQEQCNKELEKQRKAAEKARVSQLKVTDTMLTSCQLGFEDSGGMFRLNMLLDEAVKSTNPATLSSLLDKAKKSGALSNAQCKHMFGPLAKLTGMDLDAFTKSVCITDVLAQVLGDFKSETGAYPALGNDSIKVRGNTVKLWKELGMGNDKQLYDECGMIVAKMKYMPDAYSVLMMLMHLGTDMLKESRCNGITASTWIALMISGSISMDSFVQAYNAHEMDQHDDANGVYRMKMAGEIKLPGSYDLAAIAEDGSIVSAKDFTVDKLHLLYMDVWGSESLNGIPRKELQAAWTNLNEWIGKIMTQSQSAYGLTPSWNRAAQSCTAKAMRNESMAAFGFLEKLRDLLKMCFILARSFGSALKLPKPVTQPDPKISEKQSEISHVQTTLTQTANSKAKCITDKITVPPYEVTVAEIGGGSFITGEVNTPPEGIGAGVSKELDLRREAYSKTTEGAERDQLLGGKIVIPEHEVSIDGIPNGSLYITGDSDTPPEGITADMLNELKKRRSRYEELGKKKVGLTKRLTAKTNELDALNATAPPQVEAVLPDLGKATNGVLCHFNAQVAENHDLLWLDDESDLKEEHAVAVTEAMEQGGETPKEMGPITLV